MRKDLIFNGNRNSLTLGVELELQVLDGSRLLLTPRAQEIIDIVNNRKIKPEFFQSTLEVTTGVCNSVYDVENDLTERLTSITTAATVLNLKIASTGTHPEADYRERLVTPSPRYNELMDRNQWIIRRMAVYGMHVHLAMRNGDECIRNHNFYLHFIPHLIALSASSPFYQMLNTGLAAARPTTYEAMPTSGMPYIFKTWKQFNTMYQTLVRTGSINSIKDLWLDMRPSPELGTLEIRICDEPATLKEALAIVAFIHLLGQWYEIHSEEWDLAHKRLNRWIFRENKWRALRYGLRGELIHSVNKKTFSISENIIHWLDKLYPLAEQNNYVHHINLLREITVKGNSAERQLAVFARTNKLHDVTTHNAMEFELNAPLWN
jgi:glutamate---cysteine ligase / carboxylate-amine ligase